MKWALIMMKLERKSNGRGGGIRTHTVEILSLLSPAVGLRPHNHLPFDNRPDSC